MWPFSKPQKPIPVSVVADGIRAVFEPDVDEWNFQVNRIDFTLTGHEFDVEALGWAADISRDLKAMKADIDKAIEDNWYEGINKKALHLFSVSLDDYARLGEITLTYLGDDSWGDLGLSVEIAHRKIVGVAWDD